MLFDGRSRTHAAQFLDIARHMRRLHVLNARDVSAFAPAQKRPRRLPIGRAGVFVADVDGEELREASGGFLFGSGNQASEVRERRDGLLTRYGSWFVDFLSVSNAGDINGLGAVLDGVNDPIIADADTPFIHAALELFAPARAGIVGKLLDAPRDTCRR